MSYARANPARARSVPCGSIDRHAQANRDTMHARPGEVVAVKLEPELRHLEELDAEPGK